MTTIYPFDHARVAMYRERARRLGDMIAERAIKDADAQGTLDLVIEAAAKAAPDLNRSGLRARLVWDMRDQANATLLAIEKRARQQEEALAKVAEDGFRRKLDIWDIKQAMAALAKSMRPTPTIDILEAAISVGRWRAKWTTT